MFKHLDTWHQLNTRDSQNLKFRAFTRCFPLDQYVKKWWWRCMAPHSIDYIYILNRRRISCARIRGAMVARLTPDQKVACSIHVGFNTRIINWAELHYFWVHLLFRTNPSEFLLVSFYWLCRFLRNDCRVHRIEISSLFELLLVWKEWLVLESIFLQDQVVFTCWVVFTQSLFYIPKAKMISEKVNWNQ